MSREATGFRMLPRLRGEETRMVDDDLGRDARMTKYQEYLNRLSTSDVEIRSLDYLRQLSRLHEDWENDPACQCCDWAVTELVAMADELRKFQQEMTDVHSGKSP